VYHTNLPPPPPPLPAANLGLKVRVSSHLNMLMQQLNNVTMCEFSLLIGKSWSLRKVISCRLNGQTLNCGMGTLVFQYTYISKK
jgi:hypothetical protein